MSALDFDPWAALKTQREGTPPPNPANLPNSAPDQPTGLGELGALGGGDGSELKSAPTKDVGPWLLLRLWSYGALVEAASDGALTITPHASGKRIPGALMAAARRHHASLAPWVGADTRLPMVLLEPAPAPPMQPLCPVCASRRWWQADPVGPWVCWQCEPPAIAGVMELKSV